MPRTHHIAPPPPPSPLPPGSLLLLASEYTTCSMYASTGKLLLLSGKVSQVPMHNARIHILFGVCGCENSSVLGKPTFLKAKWIYAEGLQFYQVIKQWGVFCSLQLCMQLKLCSPNGCPTRYYYSTATLPPHMSCYMSCHS